MNHIHAETYQAAFVQYLRRGTPVRWSIKQAAATEQYVWRTQRDQKVRTAHRRNDGRIFSYNDAPETGHPGAGFTCRCEAVPYIAGETEFGFHDFTTG
ncbi:MAG: minor capsid protein [Rhodobacteraceae bacterium]|nr:minor capsid protein [Paracoccaceae bacterium]